MTQDTLIYTYSEHIAENMFRQLCAHVAANQNTIVAKGESYSLLEALNAIRKGLMLPQGCKFKLLGYDLFLDTPMTFFIKFGCGRLWIGSRMIELRCKEEVVRAFRFIIKDLLPPVLEEFRSIMYEVNRRCLKADKLQSILKNNAEPMVKAALKGTGMKFEIAFHSLSATLKLWKRKPDVAVAVLYYDSFEEDLQKTIASYGH